MTGSVAYPEPVGGWLRVLLPAELYGPSGERSARDTAVDVTLVVASALTGALILVHLWAHRSTALNAVDLGLGSLACLALWFRRSRPVGVAVFVLAVSTFCALASGAALVAVFNAAIRARAREIAGAAVLGLVASTAFPLLNPAVGSFLNQEFPGFTMIPIALGWGLFVRVRRELMLSLRDRAERLEADQHRHVEDAREGERRRIAREMHDVLAHRLSLLSLQAAALESRPDASGETAAQAASIRTSAAAAVDELRDVISVLREDGLENARAPQPTLAQLPALLEESRAAGMSLGAHIDPVVVSTVPDTLQRTAYRIVQEGLTNARKHAPGAAVDLTVTPNGCAGLLVEVISRKASRISGEQDGSGGAGLIGLSERLALVGGEFHHGYEANGDFVLRASIPWTT